MTDSIGQEFMSKTRPQFALPSAQSEGAPQPPLELPYPPAAALIDLPHPNEIHIPPIDLLTAINQRKTLRQYKQQPLSLEELSFLLWCTQGVKTVTHRPVTLRTVPSAGARHAFETFLLINRVEGLESGLYRYIAIEHALLAVDLTPEASERVIHGCFDQNQVTVSAVTFVWVAVLERMKWRYGERGYRYLHLDAGHVCQNLYLAAEAVGCGACAIAAFDDDQINTAVGADGENLFTIYAASLGKK